MENQKIKCVVWDLDNTLWEGVLLEDEHVTLRQEIVDIIVELDRRGILQSISSKNDHETAQKKLEQFGLWQYFIYPQINWNAKSESVSEIARLINIGIDTLALVDDQIFEREEVMFSHPEVLCIDALRPESILSTERMMPKYITSDSKKRREMYQNDIKRNEREEKFTGTKEEFLGTLDMVLTVSGAREEDLQRAEELTVRTHQLNSTGTVYSYEQLKKCIESDGHEVLMAQLDDIYGQYGKISLAVIEKDEGIWRLNLLLASCRVMSKGVGNVLMNYIINKAKANNVTLRASFVPTNRNRLMYITYKFNGFKELSNDGERIELEADLSYERVMPEYLTLVDKG